MTPWHYRYISEFVYNDPSACSGTLGEASRRLLAREGSGNPCDALSEDMRQSLRVIADTPALADTRLELCRNRNDENGFVGFAMRAPDGETVCAFRGSETRGCKAVSDVDWLDNFVAAFSCSAQYADADAFAKRYPSGRVTFTGHSKGAHNALYALSCSENPESRAVAFNGQGFAPGALTREQRARMKRGVNYVAEGDVVGALLRHPEKRVFVKQRGNDSAHKLQSIAFDEHGAPIPGHRPLWSRALGAASLLVARAYKGAPKCELSPTNPPSLAADDGNVIY